MLSVILIILFMLALSIVCLLPPGKGKLTPFLDEDHKEITTSVSEKRVIHVDGEELGIIVRGKDETRPVLLYLGGGPGIPQYLLEYMYPTKLEEQFVVCYLEYRGSSLSYHSDMNVEDMTTERYLSDVLAVTKYLRDRFNQSKIYLMGHSFGTYIGLQTAYQHPEYYSAYIAMSQNTYQEKSEKLAYQSMLDQCRREGNSALAHKLEKYPILTSKKAYNEYFHAPVRDTAMHELGVGTTHQMRSVVREIFFPSLRCMAYTPSERINIWKAKIFLAGAPVIADGIHFNAFEKVPSLKIPIYFLAGKYDMTCCYSLQKEYYEQVEAPKKEFYTFENSAHSPLYEEPEKAADILNKIMTENN